MQSLTFINILFNHLRRFVGKISVIGCNKFDSFPLFFLQPIPKTEEESKKNLIVEERL